MIPGDIFSSQKTAFASDSLWHLMVAELHNFPAFGTSGSVFLPPEDRGTQQELRYLTRNPWDSRLRVISNFRIIFHLAASFFNLQSPISTSYRKTSVSNGTTAKLPPRCRKSCRPSGGNGVEVWSTAQLPRWVPTRRFRVRKQLRRCEWFRKLGFELYEVCLVMLQWKFLGWLKKSPSSNRAMTMTSFWKVPCWIYQARLWYLCLLSRRSCISALNEVTLKVAHPSQELNAYSLSKLI